MYNIFDLSMSKLQEENEQQTRRQMTISLNNDKTIKYLEILKSGIESSN